MPCALDAEWADGLLDYLWEYHPKPLSRIVGELGLGAREPDDVAKGYGAWVVDELIAQPGSAYSRSKLEGLGVTLKTVRMPQDGRPYESMSFPAFDHTTLATEEWEDSRLRADLNCLLIVTLYGPDRITPLSECTLGHAFFWHPNEQEEAVIRGEWIAIRDLVRRGRTHDIPTEANSRAIHVRPHGRDSGDVVPDVRGRPVVRSSLWLNKDFVLRIVLANR